MPYRPMARPRSWSGNTWKMMTMASGWITPAMAPWMMRAATMEPALQLKAPNREAAMKMPMAAMYT